MERPNISDIRPDVAAYIGALEMDSAHKQESLDKQEAQIATLVRRVTDLEQMLINLQRMYFGHKSEKIKPAMDGMEQLSFLAE